MHFTKGLLVVLSIFLISLSIKGQNEFITVWYLPLAEGSGKDSISFRCTSNADSIAFSWEEIGGNNASGTGKFAPSETAIGLKFTGVDENARVSLHILTPEGKNIHNISFQGIDADRLIDVSSWGNNIWGSMAEMFAGCSYLTTFSATNVPLLGENCSFREMFAGAVSFNGNINSWDVSTVLNMDKMFSYATSFNQPLNSWDVSSVTNMQDLFEDAESFNQPLDNWDVSSVTNLIQTFYGAKSFNQPLSTWDVSSVRGMQGMFQNALSFDQPLNIWNVTSVTSMQNMFKGASSFNQTLQDWDVSSVTNMESMFEEATAFNKPLNDWDVSSVSNMENMFKKAATFNQPLNSWDVTRITTMRSMFEEATAFNQPLNSWELSSVITMYRMFNDAISFNQPLDEWELPSLLPEGYSLGLSLDRSGISCENYGKTLIGWAYNENTGNNISLYVRDMKYDQYTQSPRNLLIAKGWRIFGDSLTDRNCLTNSTVIETKGKQIRTELVIFPNPGNDIIHIGGNEKISELTIFSVSGKRVEVESQNNKNLFDASTLAEGIYLINVTYQNGFVAQSKFIKQ